MKKLLHDISFVVVNYNGYKDTLELLESIRRNLSGPDYEVVVVDNGSRVDECELMRSRFSSFVFIRSEINLGFAGGNNLGIRNSHSRYVMLLNNDTVLPDNSITDMLSFMDADTSIGAASPKICFYSDNLIIQYAGYTEMSRITLRNKGIGYKEPDDGSFDDTSETYFAHGAAMLVRRDAIEAAGFMPEEYFLYYEEIDWSNRIREAGYTIWYYPHVKVLHKESATVGADTSLKSYYITRNRFLFARRNRRGLVRYLSYLYLAFVSVPKSLLKSFLNGRLDLVKAISRGFVHFIRISVT